MINLFLASVAFVGMGVIGMVGMAMAANSPDVDKLTELNRQYVQAARSSDVAWFEHNLGADFHCTNADGSFVDRPQFLKQTAVPRKVTNGELLDVDVRVMGDFALIHARTTYTTADGKAGSIRYTDAWARRDGRWVAVMAHITPAQP